MNEELRRINEEIGGLQRTFEGRSDYTELRDFFLEMQQRGLAIRHPYGLREPHLSPPPPAKPSSSAWFGEHVSRNELAGSHDAGGGWVGRRP